MPASDAPGMVPTKDYSKSPTAPKTMALGDNDGYRHGAGTSMTRPVVTPKATPAATNRPFIGPIQTVQKTVITPIKRDGVVRQVASTTSKPIMTRAQVTKTMSSAGDTKIPGKSATNRPFIGPIQTVEKTTLSSVRRDGKVKQVASTTFEPVMTRAQVTKALANEGDTKTRTGGQGKGVDDDKRPPKTPLTGADTSGSDDSTTGIIKISHGNEQGSGAKAKGKTRTGAFVAGEGDRGKNGGRQSSAGVFQAGSNGGRNNKDFGGSTAVAVGPGGTSGMSDIQKVRKYSFQIEKTQGKIAGLQEKEAKIKSLMAGASDPGQKQQLASQLNAVQLQQRKAGERLSNKQDKLVKVETRMAAGGVDPSSQGIKAVAIAGVKKGDKGNKGGKGLGDVGGPDDGRPQAANLAGGYNATGNGNNTQNALAGAGGPNKGNGQGGGNRGNGGGNGGGNGTGNEGRGGQFQQAVAVGPQNAGVPGNGGGNFTFGGPEDGRPQAVGLGNGNGNGNKGNGQGGGNRGNGGGNGGGNGTGNEGRGQWQQAVAVAQGGGNGNRGNGQANVPQAVAVGPGPTNGANFTFGGAQDGRPQVASFGSAGNGNGNNGNGNGNGGGNGNRAGNGGGGGNGGGNQNALAVGGPVGGGNGGGNGGGGNGGNGGGNGNGNGGGNGNRPMGGPVGGGGGGNDSPSRPPATVSLGNGGGGTGNRRNGR